jgi:hypothetical protein
MKNDTRITPEAVKGLKTSDKAHLFSNYLRYVLRYFDPLKLDAIITTFKVIFDEESKNEYSNLIEQNKMLLEALKNIALWPGNLPDAMYLSKTGSNDAALRGSMVVAMRQFASAAIKKTESNKNVSIAINHAQSK